MEEGPRVTSPHLLIVPAAARRSGACAHLAQVAARLHFPLAERNGVALDQSCAKLGLADVAGAQPVKVTEEVGHSDAVPPDCLLHALEHLIRVDGWLGCNEHLGAAGHWH
eukprot:scaffold108671_cov27-Tisochrysis_lutea.AAC.5